MIVPFIPAHAGEVIAKIQAGQAGVQLSAAHGEQLVNGLAAWSCLDSDYNCVACAGLLQVWPNRVLAWALLSRDAGRFMKEITATTLQVLDNCTATRVELHCRPGFHQAFRWARLLGFEYEAMLEGADPLGGDMCLFKRIKRG